MVRILAGEPNVLPPYFGPPQPMAEARSRETATAPGYPPGAKLRPAGRSAATGVPRPGPQLTVQRASETAGDGLPGAEPSCDNFSAPTPAPRPARPLGRVLAMLPTTCFHFGEAGPMRLTISSGNPSRRRVPRTGPNDDGPSARRRCDLSRRSRHQFHRPASPGPSNRHGSLLP